MAQDLAEAKRAWDEERLLDVHELLSGTTSEEEWVECAKREARDAYALYETLRQGGGLASSDAWRLGASSGGIEVRYRPEASTRFASVCVALELAASLTMVMTIANEVPLLERWMPGFLGFEARTLLQVSRFRQLVWMRVRLPFPLAPRDVIFDAMGVDALNRDPPCVLIVVRNPDPNDWPDVDLSGPTDGAVRATILTAGAMIIPRTDNSCAFANVMNLDPHLDFLPGWLFNWVNRRLVWYAFDAFRAKVAKVQEDGLSQDYLDRVHKNPATYLELKRRVAAWEGPATPQQ